MVMECVKWCQDLLCMNMVCMGLVVCVDMVGFNQAFCQPLVKVIFLS